MFSIHLYPTVREAVSLIACLITCLAISEMENRASGNQVITSENVFVGPPEDHENLVLLLKLSVVKLTMTVSVPSECLRYVHTDHRVPGWPDPSLGDLPPWTLRRGNGRGQEEGRTKIRCCCTR